MFFLSLLPLYIQIKIRMRYFANIPHDNVSKKIMSICLFFFFYYHWNLKLYLTTLGQFLSSLHNSFLLRLLDISWGKYFASTEEETWFYLDNSSLALGWQQKSQALHMLNNIPQ